MGFLFCLTFYLFLKVSPKNIHYRKAKNLDFRGCRQTKPSGERTTTRQGDLLIIKIISGLPEDFV